MVIAIGQGERVERVSSASSASSGHLRLERASRSRSPVRGVPVHLRVRDGAIRYWLSSGSGSLELSPAAASEPDFFVMVFAGLSYPERWYTDGLRVMTTTYPIKPPLYAITKSTNYLPNVLMQMEAKEVGFDNGVFVDENDHVGESSNMNVALVTQDGVLKHPKFRSHLVRLHVAPPAGARPRPAVHQVDAINHDLSGAQPR